ncbi:MAG: phosphatidylglycerol lysyltransferase domain-containing protein, partial [Candidatus Symbiothrix sp.]|nr:phosphatidylglycerol lysyltransferase domain-containing protein [Candidatus Symbiothrix sp.]
MLDFKPVTIDDKASIGFFFDKSDFGNCDFSFSNIFCWKHLYNTTYAIEDGFLYFRFQAGKNLPGYLYPLGEGEIRKAIERIRQDARKRDLPFHLYAVTKEMFNRIEAAMPGQFIYEKIRNWYEYIYSSSDLISLVGKKYQS